jgi:hypothetical protein
MTLTGAGRQACLCGCGGSARSAQARLPCLLPLAHEQSLEEGGPERWLGAG